MGDIRGTRKWRRMRDRYRQGQPLCAECNRQGRVREWGELDHIDGDPTNNAWDNLQGLCKPCHDVKTREQMGWKAKGGCDVNGNPLNPGAHWC